MSAPIDQPIRVVVQNFPDAPARDPLVKKTTLKTYILDPANAANNSYAICDYEPKRIRMVVQVMDAPCLLTTDAPQAPAPASIAGGPPPQGLYLVNSVMNEYEFFGPDAFWLVAITGSTAGRVTVIREYC